MSVSNINVRVDSQVKSQARQVFASLGLDMTAAVNLFLRQAIHQRSLPFSPEEPLIAPVRKKTPMPGCLHGKIWIAEDFNAPLEDFREYME